jgi:hypothetical protein
MTSPQICPINTGTIPPGHSPGNQSVMMATRNRPLAIAGDAVFAYDNQQLAGTHLPYTIMGASWTFGLPCAAWMRSCGGRQLSCPVTTCTRWTIAFTQPRNNRLEVLKQDKSDSPLCDSYFVSLLVSHGRTLFRNSELSEVPENGLAVLRPSFRATSRAIFANSITAA